MPQLARDATELTVFQRTPIWVVPKPDLPIPAVVRRLFRRAPVTQRIARAVNTSILELIMVVGVLKFRQAHRVNALAALASRAHLRMQVRDRRTREKLTPDYDFGCKRPTFSNDYWRSFDRTNVHLETDGLARIEPGGIVTRTGRTIAADTLVLATGYDLWDTNFPAFEIVGRDDRELGAWWRENRFQAYEGITVPRFPNLLSLNSPYAYSGLSYFTTIEAQMKHLERLFTEMRRRGADVFEVEESANTAFLDDATARLEDSVFYAGDCATSRSYYFNQHGEATLLRPNSTLRTHRAATSFPLDDYRYESRPRRSDPARSDSIDAVPR
ncbi:flavin-binding monooxygenase [Rhodococcus rhodnii LMG 5362]|uniref:Flavin-binding monooxygenase n=1 Tax=Rhodococcus rhodnii LMG 5362 TaxID=1273125 RepID=R7WM02_9NOCA|nr:flavin-binding monooxygenase [Rhodococcus rhodnii LMG 5362]